MTKLLVVTVTDAAGQVLLQQQVDVSVSAGTNADKAELTEVETALFVVGPELCPWDCDSCRGSIEPQS